MPENVTPWEVKLRDRVAYYLAKAALRLASREYRAYLTIVYKVGQRNLPIALSEHMSSQPEASAGS